MKTNKYSFLDTLQDFIESYLPLEKGCSEKTVESYKTTYRLLLDYLYNQKNLSADQVTFEKLDYGTISGFLDWLQEERKCSARKEPKACRTEFFFQICHEYQSRGYFLQEHAWENPPEENPGKHHASLHLGGSPDPDGNAE